MQSLSPQTQSSCLIIISISSVSDTLHHQLHIGLHNSSGLQSHTCATHPLCWSGAFIIPGTVSYRAVTLTEVKDLTDADKLAKHKAVQGQLLNAIVQKLPSNVFMRHLKDKTPYTLWQGLKVEFGLVSIAATT
jgi:hypothetical protein